MTDTSRKIFADVIWWSTKTIISALNEVCYNRQSYMAVP